MGLWLQVLLNHIVPSELRAEDLVEAVMDAAPELAMVTTLAGSTLEGVIEGDDFFGRPTGTDIMARIVTYDIETCAGVMHVIDAVLVPAPAEEEEVNVEMRELVDMGGDYGAYGAYGE